MDWQHLLAYIPGVSIRNCSCIMNNWQPRTASCVPKSRIGCNCQTERNPLWPTLPAGWNAKLWPKSPSSLSATPCRTRRSAIL